MRRIGNGIGMLLGVGLLILSGLLTITAIIWAIRLLAQQLP
jgi:hypothetical protein